MIKFTLVDIDIWCNISVFYIYSDFYISFKIQIQITNIFTQIKINQTLYGFQYRLGDLKH